MLHLCIFAAAVIDVSTRASVNMQSAPHLPPYEDYIFSFASTATKKISDSVVETAQTIKKSVEDGNIDSIIDKACCHFGWSDWLHRFIKRTIYAVLLFSH